ncbi:6-bladed beta-propeller [Polaribacter batillariae]|uniref:6-bladed beta-propeller n=1 Tax=Polaribacter batillariae TaxID=2808900 RepID=A0ABX7SZQ6_9FLAO|nr:BF3164 family lipoprotein [Polaribacter batillariae]QTD38778.1 6-bladed beta-propeller [Polaribacter batillariae]
MRIKALLLCVFCIIISSCSKHKGIEISKLKKERVIERLSDSSFIYDVRAIINYNEDIYLSDYKRNQVIVLDESLKLKKTLGSAGKGPGEFIGPSQLFIDNDTIYVMNDGHRTIEAFDFFKHQKTISPPKEIRLSAEKKFVKSNNYFYLSNVNSHGSISRYNSYNKNIKQFGLIEKYRTEKETRIKNGKYILKYQDFIIAVSDNKPKLEMYNMTGDFVLEFDYRSIKSVSNTMDYIEKQKQEENSYYEFVSDAYLFSDKLYLLTLFYNQNKMFSNKVLEIEINNTAFRASRLLDLGNDWFESICITKGTLLASNGSLVEFKLK